jgi:hypothetical protein
MATALQSGALKIHGSPVERQCSRSNGRSDLYPDAQPTAAATFENAMNSSLSIGTGMRSPSQSWARLFVELIEPDESSVAVEWLQLDEVIVLETLAEPA